MTYQVVIDKPAKKFIEKQPKKQQLRILKAIKGLPLNGDIKPLKGHKETYRLRVGDYRILYSVCNENLLILIMDANNRGDIYKSI